MLTINESTKFHVTAKSVTLYPGFKATCPVTIPAGVAIYCAMPSGTAATSKTV